MQCELTEKTYRWNLETARILANFPFAIFCGNESTYHVCTWIWTFICGLKHIKVEWGLNLLCKIILYLVQITKLHNCATPTPATKSGVVSYPNMIDTSTKDQMRNPTVNRIQSSTKTLISFFTPMSRRTLTRAYLILQREKASLVM